MSIDEEMNINRGSYDGKGGSDFLRTSDINDALFLDDGMGSPVLKDIETIVAGSGNDVIVIADDVLTYGNISINGAGGNDII